MTILKRLLPSQDIDALLGDIAEESRRRSRLWDFWQLTALVVGSCWRVVRAHPVLMLRAVAVGVASLIAWEYTLVRAIIDVTQLARPGLIPRYAILGFLVLASVLLGGCVNQSLPRASS